jgi:hypothetical protein
VDAPLHRALFLKRLHCALPQILPIQEVGFASKRFRPEATTISGCSRPVDTTWRGRWPRYAHASRREKSQLLDEFCAITGYTRKHALVLLSDPSAEDRRAHGGGRPLSYGLAEVALLRMCWSATDGICSKRLARFLPELLERQLGDPLLAEYLAFVGARAAEYLAGSRLRSQGVLLGRRQAARRSEDGGCVGFLTNQRSPRHGSAVVRLGDGEAGLAARTIARSMSSVLGPQSVRLPGGTLAPQPLAALDLLDYRQPAGRRIGREVLASLSETKLHVLARHSARARATSGPLLGKLTTASTDVPRDLWWRRSACPGKGSKMSMRTCSNTLHWV